ncbi:hypothetical protein HPB50_015939 [Hyalomma asiaticum]|uniref:Uncharacterized protein n=1 Tax=Hyalomma asiaticum TaxID=266040 RepID=A0ACB7S994_HYAAI|nr:hypothetical protein HPB50_015939 [Hyalomma asiaticum]
MLMDRLVLGIPDIIVQQRLLVEKNMIFATAYDAAVPAECAAKHQRAIGSERHEIPDAKATMATQRLKKGRDEKVSGAQSERLRFLYVGNHAAYRCKFKNAVCLNLSSKSPAAKSLGRKKMGR